MNYKRFTDIYYEINDKEIRSLLLKKSKEIIFSFKNDINDNNEYGNTLLSTSIIREDLILSEFLLNHGADINKKNKIGNTPLSEYLISGRSFDRGFDLKNSLINRKIFDTVKFLLDKGADPYIRDEYNYVALTSASFRGTLPAVNALIEYGVDVNYESDYRSSALCSAIYYHDDRHNKNYRNNIDVIKLLISHGANIDHEDPNITEDIRILIEEIQH